MFHYYIFHFPVFWLLIFETHRSALSEHRIDHIRRVRKTKTTHTKLLESSLFYDKQKNPDALKRSLLSKPSLKKNKAKVWIVKCDVFVTPLSVRIFALFYRVLSWHILRMLFAMHYHVEIG